MSTTAERVVAEARSWLGTPYRHQASTKGQGADCLGLVRGVWRALYGAEPQAVPAYTPDWAERGEAETLLLAACRWLDRIEATDPRPGDILLFRFAPGCPAKHCAIVSRPNRMIHVWQGRAVCETWRGRWWQHRQCAAFRFPSDIKA